MENPFFTMQSLFWYDYLASLNREEGSDDLRLLNSLYQIRYRQNYETLKIEHKDSLSQNISYVALKKYLHSGSEGRRLAIKYDFRMKSIVCIVLKRKSIFSFARFHFTKSITRKTMQIS